MRVLIAEDEALIRMDLREMLAEEGHDVVGEARDGAEAVALARTLHPDVIFMDVKMPGTDGLVAAEVIGAENVVLLKRKTWTEDFASFTEVVPGALVLLGSEIAGSRRIAHSATFDIDESCLSIGAAILVETACRLIAEAATPQSKSVTGA